LGKIIAQSTSAFIAGQSVFPNSVDVVANIAFDVVDDLVEVGL